MSEKQNYFPLKIQKTKISPKDRKMEIGKFMVCAENGQLVSLTKDEKGNKYWIRLYDRKRTDKVLTLKEFYETKFNKPFVEEEWKFETEDISIINKIKPKTE